MKPRWILTAAAVVLFLVGPFAAALHAQQDGTIEDLGTLGIDSVAYAVNASGQAAGDSLVTATDQQAFVTIGGAMQALPSFGGNDSSALGINDAGVVVGYSRTAAGTLRAFRFDPATDTELLDLGDLGGGYSWAYDINNAGTIVGYSGTADGGEEAFVWTQDNGIVSLGGGFSYAYGVNNANQVVGQVVTTNGLNLEAFVYSNGAMQRLGSLAGDSIAIAINDAGVVAGTTEIPGGGTRAFRYTASDGMVELPNLGGFAASAEDIAPDGTIVGRCSTATPGPTRACMWTPSGEVVDLNERFPDPNDEWLLTVAAGINGNGQIVGWGQHNGELRAFRLTLPVTSTPPPSTKPTIHSITATPSSLWPSNNKLVPVVVTVDATDASGAQVPCAITDVTSNEPADGDIVVTGPLQVELRATRLGSGNGRTYRIEVACGTDPEAMATDFVEVVVPKNQSGGSSGERKKK